MQMIHITGKVVRKNYNPEKGILSLVVPSTERYTNKMGEKVEDTEWFVVKVFSPRAPKIEQYITEGMLISVSGKVKTSAYMTRNGEPRAETRVMCDKIEWFYLEKKENHSNEFNKQLAQNAQETDLDDDDDLPF